MSKISADHENDLSVPGEPYTFGAVADAQVVGDFQTLQSLGQRVVRIRFNKCDWAAITKLNEESA